MKSVPHKTERIHSLDSLRAIMMLLGLVIHSAITYGVVDYGASWTIKDPAATHISNDYIVGFVHAFRMQIFFVVAGFFGSMLFYERQPLKMIKNRASRILFPFLVFVILLWPSIVFCFGYTRYVFAGSSSPFAEAWAGMSNMEAWFPQRTFHLWFLYYLILITAASVVLGFLFRKLPAVSKTINKISNKIFKGPLLRILIFATLTCVVYAIMGTPSVSTSTSFVPDYNTFLYYFFFYVAGWIMFKSKHLLHTMTRFDWVSTLLGIIVFSFYFFENESLSYEAKIIVKSCMVWLFIFGITGLFIRYGSRHSSRMRYISDSSYWVYLMHLSLTAIIPGLIAHWPLSSSLKFLVVLVVSGAICFLSYHYFVRGTFVGKFLNGRTYTRKLSDIKPMESRTALEPVMDK